jgi:uncharacterized protein YndB with AHSA1/START domain
MIEVRIADEIGIAAPLATVWRAIADPADHANWHPFVTDIVGGHELGQARTCSVLIGGKPGQTRERCVEREAGRRIVWAIEEDSTGFGRMVLGWKAGFAMAEQDGLTTVTAESTFEPRNLLVRAMLPILRRKFHQTQGTILHALKDSLESRPSDVDLSVSRS